MVPMDLQPEGPVALWPLYSTHIGTLSAGRTVSDWTGPIFGPDYPMRGTFIRSIFRGIEHHSPVDVGPLRDEDYAFGAKGPKRFLVGTSQSITLRSTWNEQLETLSKSLRQDLKRLDDTDCVLTTDSDSPAVFEALVSLHKQRSQSTRRWSTFTTRKSLQFHRSLMEDPWSGDIVRLVRVESGGAIVAVAYGLVSGKAGYFYQSGFDPSSKSLSPGSLALAGFMRYCIESGLERLFLLRGNESYKQRWSPDTFHQHWRVMSFGRNPLEWPIGLFYRPLGLIESYARRWMDKPPKANRPRDVGSMERQ